MTSDQERICEVCGDPIVAGDRVVLGQEADGATVDGILDATSDGRLALFHEDHWDDRIGPWIERDRGQTTAR